MRGEEDHFNWDCRQIQTIVIFTNAGGIYFTAKIKLTMEQIYTDRLENLILLFRQIELYVIQVKTYLSLLMQYYAKPKA